METHEMETFPGEETKEYVFVLLLFILRKTVASAVVVHKLTDAHLTLFFLLLIHWYFWPCRSC